jgi:ssDNA-binding Zn-finger/Zn-ribbon topoisomerase 1
VPTEVKLMRALWPGERTDLKCPEPGCAGRLVLKESKYGLFYGCEFWPIDRCPGSHGAHPDGAPLGEPADQATKKARMRAHDAFDRLWKGRGAPMSRTEAYEWVQEAMGMTSEEAHIGRFSLEECDGLIASLAPLLQDLEEQRMVREAERRQKRTRKRAERRKRAKARKGKLMAGEGALHPLEVSTIEHVRRFVRDNPDHGLSTAWRQMLEDIDSFGEEFTIADFQEEADIQKYKGAW